MIRSMTGYGRSQQLINGRDITVEVKSVNHRYFEFSSRIPRAYAYLEEKLKAYVQKSVSRGKIDVNVTIITVEGDNTDVEINHELASAYIKALRELGKREILNDDISLSTISRFSDIFAIRKTSNDEEQIWNDVKAVSDKALESFISMREAEGERMKTDVLSRLLLIEESVEKVEEKSIKTVEAYREKLFLKLKEVLDDRNIDEHRILTEAAIFAEKVAVDEETVRLKSHLKQCREILEYKEAVGRKLDFLVQEFNREANTIGSKAQDIEIARIVINIKSEIEKIREQIQNIE
ncbi:MAG: YicC/YloC family endoribonuclease [Oscillospiraceae bacterium]